MNEYRITYTGGDGVRDVIQVVERSDSAARKDFKANYKGVTILTIELTAENVCATKQQERDTLAKIKQMVEELGPQSYVGTAFEGCWQDAEDNIEYDYGCSMKQKLESAEFAEDELRRKLADANERLSQQYDRLIELEEARSTLEAELRTKALPAWLHTDIRALLNEESAAARKRMEIAAENMATMADAPQDISFARSVDSYRVNAELIL